MYITGKKHQYNTNQFENLFQSKGNPKSFWKRLKYINRDFVDRNRLVETEDIRDFFESLFTQIENDGEELP